MRRYVCLQIQQASDDGSSAIPRAVQQLPDTNGQYVLPNDCIPHTCASWSCISYIAKLFSRVHQFNKANVAIVSFPLIVVDSLEDLVTSAEYLGDAINSVSSADVLLERVVGIELILECSIQAACACNSLPDWRQHLQRASVQQSFFETDPCCLQRVFWMKLNAERMHHVDGICCKVPSCLK